MHKERLHFVLVVVVVVEVAHVALSVMMRVYGRIITRILMSLRVMVPRLLLLEDFVLADLLLQKCFVFGFLIVSRHPRLVNCALNINLIGTESFMM